MNYYLEGESVAFHLTSKDGNSNFGVWYVILDRGVGSMGWKGVGGGGGGVPGVNPLN